MNNNEGHKGYWRENVGLVLKLLAIWFIASYGMGVLFVDALNEFKFFGFPFGFWMAQQGAIYIFVILIFVYVAKMNSLDRKYGVEESDDDVPVEDITNNKEGE